MKGHSATVGHDALEHVAAPLHRVRDVLTRCVQYLHHAAEARRVRDELAEMDEALLKDIGIAEDEIWRIRARHRFTPRAWGA